MPDGWSESTKIWLLNFSKPYAETLRQTTPEIRVGKYQSGVKRFEALRQTRED